MNSNEGEIWPCPRCLGTGRVAFRKNGVLLKTTTRCGTCLGGGRVRVVPFTPETESTPEDTL